MIYVTSAKYEGDYKIWCQFSNGKSGVVNLKDELWGPIFEPLKEIEQFKKFQVSNIFHTISWDNGADFAPEFLYDHIK